ncbi:MAG TPA: DUF998 domain-containing protein [Cellulomonas sp.]
MTTPGGPHRSEQPDRSRQATSTEASTEVQAAPSTPRPPSDPVVPTGPARPAVRVIVVAVLAPVLMIGGWTLAAAVQDGFDPVRRTISDLAADGAAHRGIMVAAEVLAGLSLVLVALGLRAVAPSGRLLLALGGAGTVGAALVPVDRAEPVHLAAAGVALVSLVLWPVVGRRASHGAGTEPGTSAVPAVLRRSTGVLVTLVLLTLGGWLLAEGLGLAPDAPATTGLAERVLVAAASLWPCVVVVALHTRSRLRPPGAVPGRDGC